MKFDVIGGKLTVQRSSEEKLPFISRLSRIEGQIRGLRQMIEEDRFCGDVMQQSSAVTAAVREVTLMMVSQQVQAHVEAIGLDGESGTGDSSTKELVDMLRSAYCFQQA